MIGRTLGWILVLIVAIAMLVYALWPAEVASVTGF